jgi:L-threonylcarbamoyladenylate synthase
MKMLPCNESSLETAAELLNSGGVAVIPTDTVYGIAAKPDFPGAVERLYTIKGRESGKKIALLASGVDAVEAFGYRLSQRAKELASKYWPGALTMVIGDEGFRVPDHEWTRRLLAKCGGVLRVTSANLSGCRPATDVPQALADVGLSADIVLDGGVSPGGVASTVVRIGADGETEILRKGAIEI